MRVMLLAVMLPLALALVSPAARAEDTEPPKITFTPVTTAKKGAPVHISAKITDQSKFFPQVFYKWDGGAFEKAIDMKAMKGKKAKNMYEAFIPAKGQTTLEYYLEAYDEQGNGPSRAGTPEAPFKIDFAPAQAADDAPPAVAPTVAPTEPVKEEPAVAKEEPKKEEPPPAAVKEEPKKEEPPPVVETPKAEEPPPAATASARGGRTWTWIVGGTGLGMLAGGALTGLAFKKADDAYNARLTDPTNNPSTLKQQYDANKSLGTTSTIMLVSGGVLLAGGVALYFLEAPRSSSGRADRADGKDQRLQFAAAPTQGGAAAVVAGRF